MDFAGIVQIFFHNSRYCTSCRTATAMNHLRLSCWTLMWKEEESLKVTYTKKGNPSLWGCPLSIYFVKSITNLQNVFCTQQYKHPSAREL